MNNLEVEQTLINCETELDKVKIIIDVFGSTHEIVPYLTKYSLIRACGTIEQAFKTIVSDFCSQRGKKQVKRFLTKMVRESSMNPSFDNICKLLKKFDDNWHANLKIQLDNLPNKSALKTSLQSLVDARNDFAHGGHPTASFGDIQQHFKHAKEMMEILDNVVN
jgi:hypothetical protein